MISPAGPMVLPLNFAVPDADKLPVGVYKFLAVGRDATDRFSVTTPTSGNTNYTDMLASIVNSAMNRKSLRVRPMRK